MAAINDLISQIQDKELRERTSSDAYLFTSDLYRRQGKA